MPSQYVISNLLTGLGYEAVSGESGTTIDEPHFHCWYNPESEIEIIVRSNETLLDVVNKLLKISYKSGRSSGISEVQGYFKKAMSL